jgi:hypothetical protein
MPSKTATVTMAFIKQMILAGLIAIMSPAAQVCAASYYVDGTNGSDANHGTSITNAWKTIDKANHALAAGDTVFIRGGTYAGQIIQPARSGVSETARIVYAAYNGEHVLFRDAAHGIYLYKKSFITVSGIRFVSLRRFLRIYAGHYNVISHCTFDQRSPASEDWAGGRIANDFRDTTSNSEPSTYNRVQHCHFTRWSYGAFADHRGSLLDIGHSVKTGDLSSYNLIEDNIFSYGGHHTLGVYAPYNVIRRNYFHNETNQDEWEHEGYRSSITEGPSAGRSLYEGNRFGHTDTSGMALRSSRNIFRFNYFYHNGAGGIQVVSNLAGVDRADENRIYHNTFYHNGHQATYAGFQGGMYFANWSNQSPIGNVVKNNLFFANRNGSVSYDGAVAAQVVENNWDRNAVDPGLVDLSGSGPGNPSKPDLRLRSDSSAIDQGACLTTITSACGAGTSFGVEDAGYFMDGWGIPGVQGDEIQLAHSRQRVRITHVDYKANLITVETPLTWTQGRGVSLAYEGSAPDLGAYEYAKR